MKYHKDQTAATINLSALIEQIMSSESIRQDPGGAAFQSHNLRNPNLEGTNVGAAMIIHRGAGFSSGEPVVYGRSRSLVNFERFKVGQMVFKEKQE
nr:hypothetical protein CTI12_AA358140 [Tanacetum cinerariifolium]